MGSGASSGEVRTGFPLAHRWRNVALAGGGYLLLSLGMWWGVWSNHPTSTSICGCGDTSLFIWFIDWPAYAVSHGLNPFYSTAMGYPHGVNLLANTSVLAIGVPMIPVTWVFGPIATLNVALLLSPVLTGLAMFVLLRRWVSWQPAAFVGGLLYGFSPMILTSLDYSHLMLTMSPVPPLMVLCLDELLIRQRRRPIPTGALLGLLVTIQFFLSTELLVIMMIGGLIGVALVVAYAGMRKPHVLGDHARFAVVGLAAGATTAAVLLCYPAWFALAGPAHLSGSIWPQNLGQDTSVLKKYVVATPPLSWGGQYGFNGLILSGQYLGSGLVAVLLCGLVAWRRDLRLWLFALLGVASVLLALGGANPLFSWLPLLENILPNRFDAVVYLCAAIMLGIVVDHTRDSVSRWYAGRREVDHGTVAAERGAQPLDPPPSGRTRGPVRGGVAALGGLVVAAIALVQVSGYLSQNVPIPVQSLTVPPWFLAVAPHLPAGQVLLVLPDNLTGLSPLTWQVIDGMRYAMVDEGGPGGAATRAGREQSALGVIATISSPAFVTASYSKAALTITPGKIASVRAALDAWHVTTVVIPDHPGLPVLAQLPSVTTAAALVSAATGQRPVYRHGAWIWTAVDGARRPIATTTSELSDCTGAGSRGIEPVEAAAACITSRKPYVRLVASADGINLMQNRVLMTIAAHSQALARVEFDITGRGIAGSLAVPARPFADGPLRGWITNVDSLNLPPGTYAVRSVATQADGTVARSREVTRTIAGRAGATLQPVAIVRKPHPHARLSGSTYLAATARSELGVRSVEFRITGQGGTAIVPARPFAFGWLGVWNTGTLRNGTYTVASVAEGNTGLTSTGKGVVVTVKN